MTARHRVGAELGQDDRLTVPLMHPVQRVAQRGLGHVKPPGVLVPAGVAVQEDDVRGFQAGRIRQVGRVADGPGAVERPGPVA